MEVDFQLNLKELFKNSTENDSEFVKKCQQLAEDVDSLKTSVLEIVEQLGPFLTDPSPEKRALGTWVLSNVLERININVLDSNQLSYLGSFFADRLKDLHQVIPAVVAGILALMKFKKYPNSITRHILDSIFKNISTQQQQQADRQKIFKYFELTFEKCLPELQNMGFDYVYGVISAIDGERDPQNLKLIFNWYPKFLKHVKLNHLTEEAFEVMACYFPVDFKAPPQDSNAVTRESLANDLANCLSAVPTFAEFCLPLALEKLDSSLEIAKFDSLKLLEIGASTFDTSELLQSFPQIWDKIEKIILTEQNPELHKSCLLTLTAVIAKISESPDLSDALKHIFTMINANLLPESKLFDSSIDLLLTLVRASKPSAQLVLNEIVPMLSNTFNMTTTPQHRAKFLKILIKIAEAKTINLSELSEVPNFCLVALTNKSPDLCLVGFDGLQTLAHNVSLDTRRTLYTNFIELLPTIPETCEESMLDCFKTFATLYPEEVQTQVLNKIDNTNLQILESYLKALSKIAFLDYFKSQTLNTLCGYLSQDQTFGCLAIHHLRQLATRSQNNHILDHVFFNKKLVNHLINWSLKHDQLLSTECLENVNVIIKIILQNETADDQQQIIAIELEKILNNQIQNTTFITLIDAILSRLHREVTLTYNFLPNLLKLLNDKNDYTRTLAMQLLANLVNKCSKEQIINEILNSINDMESSEYFATVLAWIVKALIMRNDEKASHLIDKLVNLLKNDLKVTQCFSLIMNNNPELSSESFCIQSLLYRQKFFQTVSEKLYQKYEENHSNYLTAFIYLMENCPEQVILMDFEKLFKLIILCLDHCEDPGALCIILNIIEKFITTKQDCIENHLNDFLSRFLKLTTFPASMKVRILALICIRKMTQYPVYKLLPQRTNVLSTLAKSIDDKKRCVRKEAVEARSQWFLLDAQE